jgi:hypothetical protein
MPPAVFSSAADGSMITLSANGLMFNFAIFQLYLLIYFRFRSSNIKVQVSPVTFCAKADIKKKCQNNMTF